MGCTYEINKQHRVHMPITNSVYIVLYDKITPRVEKKLLAEQLS